MSEIQLCLEDEIYRIIELFLRCRTILKMVFLILYNWLKARAMATQLEEYTATFKGTEEEERRLLASLASLKAELKNANNQLVNLKKEAEDSSAEMEEQLSRLQADLEASIAGEARAKESLSRLHEDFEQVRNSLQNLFFSALCARMSRHYITRGHSDAYVISARC